MTMHARKNRRHPQNVYHPPQVMLWRSLMSPDMLGQKPDQWDCYALYFLLAPSVD